MDYRSVWIDEIMLFEITPDNDYVSPLPPHWPSEDSQGEIDIFYHDVRRLSSHTLQSIHRSTHPQTH